MDNIEVSVVVPIYNVEKYLRQCLESLVNQNFDDYEIILINDGATDNSMKIAQEFEDKYKNIKLISKKNAGLGAARNTGMKYVTGKYVLFVDSDDYVSPEYISELYNVINREDSDIVICSHEKIYENKTEIVNLEVDFNKAYEGIEVLGHLFSRKIRCYAWDKIYKTELFFNNEVQYLEGRLYEDILATVKLISKSKKISYINKPLYKYRIREGNITSIKTIKSIIDLNFSIEKVNKYLVDENLYSYLDDEIVNFNISYTLGSLDILSIYTNYEIKKFYSGYKDYYKNIDFNYSLMKVMLNNKVNKWVKRDYLLFKTKLLPIKNKLKNKSY